MEMTVEQKRAIALAKARQRQAQAAPQAAPPEETAPDHRSEGLGAREAGAAASVIPGDAARSGGRGEAALIGARQAATLSFGDEINAGVRAAADWMGNPLKLGDGKPFREAYDDRLAHERALLDQTWEENPASILGGEVAGSMLLPGAAMKSGATVGANALRMGATGAATGGAYGYGAGEGGVMPRLQSAAVGGAIGGAVGAAVPAIVGPLQKAATSKATRRAISEAAASAPEPAAQKAASQALFDGMEKRGVSFADQARDRLQTSLTGALAGFDDDTAAVTLRKVSRLAEKGDGGLTFNSLKNTRDALSKQSMNKMSSDGAAAAVAVKEIDGFIDNILDTDLTSGQVAGLSDDWKEARSLWKSYRNSEKIGKAIEIASDSDNFDRSIRSQFRSMLKDKKSNLSAAEKQVLREVLQGTTFGSFAREAGRRLAGSVGAAVGAGIGGAAGGVPGALVGGVVASGANRLAEGIASNASEEAARRAMGFVAGGGRFVQPAPVMLPGAENALRAGSRAAIPASVNWWNQ
jgi:hypothetical protein